MKCYSTLVLRFQINNDAYNAFWIWCYIDDVFCIIFLRGVMIILIGCLCSSARLGSILWKSITILISPTYFNLLSSQNDLRVLDIMANIASTSHWREQRSSNDEYVALNRKQRLTAVSFLVFQYEGSHNKYDFNAHFINLQKIALREQRMKALIYYQKFRQWT